MAEIAGNDVEVGPDEVIVERKIVPANRKRVSLFAVILLLAFVGTCAVVFFGDRLGLTRGGMATVKVIPPPTAP
jgi:hypothetical protein